jgi:very-short-patch-repair endonuclease
MSYKTASPDRYELLKTFARENRRNATEAEALLWEYLRNNALGVKFLRQHVIGDYIVDFVSRQDGLVIEVDGAYHSEPLQIKDDIQREQVLEQMGYHVIRFTNEEVLYNTEWVIEQIEEYFEKKNYE